MSSHPWLVKWSYTLFFQVELRSLRRKRRERRKRRRSPMTATNKIRRTTTSSPSSGGSIAADSVTACSVTASSTQPPGCKVAGIDLLGLESGFHSSPLTTLFGSALLRPVEGAANSSRSLRLLDLNKWPLFFHLWDNVHAMEFKKSWSTCPFCWT